MPHTMRQEKNLISFKEKAQLLKERIDFKTILLAATATGIGTGIILNLITNEASAQVITLSRIYLPVVTK